MREYTMDKLFNEKDCSELDQEKISNLLYGYVEQFQKILKN